MSAEYPIFVPHGEDHLAAVVTVPDAQARGLVLLLQGLGAPRSHRYRLWTRTARALADRGIASVRLDYPEIGDSTGSHPALISDPPVEEVMAVAETVREAIGATTFAVAGNCLGGRTALALAGRMSGCVGIVSILPNSLSDILWNEGRTAPHRTARRLTKKAPRLSRFVRRFVHTERIQLRLRLLPEVSTALERCKILFLYLGGEQEGKRLELGLDAEFGRDATGKRERAQVLTIPGQNLFGMRLPVDMQPLVVDAIVRWMDQILPHPDPREGVDVGRALTPRSG